MELIVCARPVGLAQIVKILLIIVQVHLVKMVAYAAKQIQVTIVFVCQAIQV
jgi:hypothetical protein